MKRRPPYALPDEKLRKLKKAKVLEWVTLGFLVTIIAVMYLTMGASQAMKTAWIEDLLSLIPPLSFLVAMHYRDRAPTDRFPYGHRRAALLSFLVAAVALLILGLYMLYDSSMSLLSQHHPTLGHFDLFGWYVWSGWVMIGALIYSAVPPVVLGRMKLPIAKDLHEKTLHADADMNKADWMTALAAILGIVGLGLGLWWADAVAAGFISLDVVRDGGRNVKRAMSALMDQRPTEVDSERELGLTERVREMVRRRSDVADADVRLREEGHVVSGEIFVVLDAPTDVAAQAASIAEEASALDWRLYDLVVMPVASLDDSP